jgi:hypothetical protein
MAMGVVTDDDFEAEINRFKNPQPKAEIKQREYGRGGGNNEVPESLRKIIGENVIENGRAETLDMARQFGISDSSVSAYTKGATSTASYHQGNPDLKNHLRNVKEKIVNKASKKLKLALDEITPDKLESVKARDLAGIAKDMSAVIKNLEPAESNDTKSTDGPTFVVYAPKIIQNENYFEAMDLKE